MGIMTFIVHFLAQTQIRKVLLKCSLNKFTLGCVYEEGEWSRELAGVQSPQKEEDDTLGTRRLAFAANSATLIMRP